MAGPTILISIVIPTLNEGERIVNLLDYLETLPGVGQIVIADASDATQSLNVLGQIRDRSNVTVLTAELPRRGVQMNLGAGACTESGILFLHCDSTPPKNAAHLISRALDKHKWGRFDLRLDGPGIGFWVIGFMIRLRSRLTRIATGDQGIFVDRGFFWKQGGFADIALMEDIELSRRLAKRWRPGLIKVPMVTSSRRWSKNGTLQTIWLMWKLRLLYRLGESPDVLSAMYRDAR